MSFTHTTDLASIAPTLQSRVFRLWTYTVSHRTLLLRSVRAAATPTRIDVVFVQVKELFLPTQTDALVIVERSLEWLAEQRPGRSETSFGSRVFELDYSHHYYVVAGAVGVHVDDRGDFEQSYFSVPRMVFD